MTSFKHILFLSLAGVGLSACSTTTPSNYKIQDKPLKVVEAELETKLIKSAEHINRQLALLNNNQHYKKGIEGEHKVPTVNNMRTITDKDVDLMIKEGRTTNNPPKSFDKVMPDRVDSQISDNRLRHFYLKPETKSIPEIPLAQPIDFSKLKPIELNEKNSKAVNDALANQVKHKKVGLERTVGLDANFNYPSTALLQELTKGAGYQFKLVGQDKAFPINFGKEAFKGTIKEALGVIGKHFENKGLVTVNVKQKTVTVKYQ